MFHKKIEKIQHDVDEMLDLCAEADGKRSFRELGAMILKSQDGNLNKGGYKRMEKQLSADRNALRYYVDFQNLTVLLCEHFNKSRLRRMPGTTKEYVFAGPA